MASGPFGMDPGAEPTPTSRRPGACGACGQVFFHHPECPDPDPDEPSEDGGLCGNCEQGLPSWQMDGSLCPRCEAEPEPE